MNIEEDLSILDCDLDYIDESVRCAAHQRVLEEVEKRAYIAVEITKSILKKFNVDLEIILNEESWMWESMALFSFASIHAFSEEAGDLREIDIYCFSSHGEEILSVLDNLKGIIYDIPGYFFTMSEEDFRFLIRMISLEEFEKFNNS